MTEINLTTDVPPSLRSGSLATLERLLAWAAMTAKALQADNKYKESNDPDFGNQFNVSVVPIETSGGEFRLVIRASLPLASDYLTAAGRAWMSVSEFDSTAIPANLKVD